MQYNLTDIFDNPDKKITEELVLELDAVQIQGKEYEIINPSAIVLTATGIETGKARVMCKFSCQVELSCDRCLTPVLTDIDIDSDVVLFSPDLMEKYTDDTDETDNASGQEFMDGYKLDIDELILSEMLLVWPSKVLCKEDCKGICSVCGCNLNDGECGCDRFVPNAAFAGLKELLNLQ